MSVEVKICGLGTAEGVEAAVAGGARLVGFVFFPPSPRAISPDAAADLAAHVPDWVAKVGLVVDADDRTIGEILARAPLDMLQLHGSESPARVAEIRRRFGLPVIKAVAISGAGDLETARSHEDAADRLLFDAKPPPGAERPGGNALVFDWELIRAGRWRTPWMLAGGLNAGNLARAVRTSGAMAVDVSSGVEDAPGVKNADKIREFLETAMGL